METEQSKISMLSRFDTISHIMPFYANTHKSFLLLSNLCSAVRNKLDEYYHEFINSMREHWIRIYSNEMNLLLPSDLFIADIWVTTESEFNIFAQFINNFREPLTF